MPHHHPQNAQQINALNLLKDEIVERLNTYISPWKFSIFGHHHNNRAKAICSAVEEADTCCEIRLILQSQWELLTRNVWGEERIARASVEHLLDLRWTSRIKNQPKIPDSSGFVSTLSRILNKAEGYCQKVETQDTKDLKSTAVPVSTNAQKPSINVVKTVEALVENHQQSTVQPDKNEENDSNAQDTTKDNLSELFFSMLHCDYTKVNELLAIDPSLALKTGSFKDFSGRSFENVYPLQIVLWLGDPTLYQSIKQYLLDDDAKTQMNEWQQHPSAKRHGIQVDLQPLIDGYKKWLNQYQHWTYEGRDNNWHDDIAEQQQKLPKWILINCYKLHKAAIYKLIDGDSYNKRFGSYFGLMCGNREYGTTKPFRAFREYCGGWNQYAEATQNAKEEWSISSDFAVDDMRKVEETRDQINDFFEKSEDPLLLNWACKAKLQEWQNVSFKM